MRSDGSAIRQQFGNIVVRAGTTSEAVVRLHDVARIELGAQQYTSSALRMNELPTVFLAVYQSPGSNAIDLQQRVRDEDGGAGEALSEGDRMGNQL